MAKGLPCAAQTEALPCHDVEEYLIFAGSEVRERMLGLLLSMGVKFIKEDEEEGEEGDGGGYEKENGRGEGEENKGEEGDMEDRRRRR